MKKLLNRLMLRVLNDKILKSFDEGLMTGMIFVDLQKIFGTIHYDILFNNMSAIGFSDHAIDWFKPYLLNRLFRVNLEKSFRSYKH